MREVASSPPQPRRTDWWVMIYGVSEEEVLTYQGRLVYSSSDPFAIAVEFYVHEHMLARWLISRESLQEGLYVRSGEGDVIISPYGTGRRQMVLITLQSTDDNRRDFLLEASTAKRFLRRTYGLVPVGTESDHIDWDGMVAAASSDEEHD
ncbi:SsgA family sporulation/cell division regulator [Streptomyces sp. NPDC055607]